jgi:hypothetical protein
LGDDHRTTRYFNVVWRRDDLAVTVSFECDASAFDQWEGTMTVSPGAGGSPAATPTVPQFAATGDQPKISVVWTGALLALGAIATIVGTVLKFEKIIIFHNGTPIETLTYSGVGSRTVTGVQALTPPAFGGSGKVVLGLGVLLLIAAILILVRRGRLWVAIVSTVLALVAVGLAAASFAAPKNDAKDLNKTAPAGFVIHAFNRIGVDIATVGAGIAVLAAILALILRRRQAVPQ